MAMSPKLKNKLSAAVVGLILAGAPRQLFSISFWMRKRVIVDGVSRRRRALDDLPWRHDG